MINFNNFRKQQADSSEYLSGFYGKDRYGRGYGKKGLTADQMKRKRLLDEAEDAVAISNMIQLAATISTGMSLVSGIQELGVKGLLKKTFELPDLGGVSKVLKPKPQKEGLFKGFFKEMLPDVRKVSDKWGVDPSLSLDKLKDLFSAEELAKLKSKGFLEHLEVGKKLKKNVR